MTPTKAKQVLVPIADGSEEIETACITDTLTRFGAVVTVASVKTTTGSNDNDDPNVLICTMSRGLRIVADCTIAEAAAKGSDYWDLVALPGGMPGATHLRDSPALIEILQRQKKCGEPYAAICAAPAVVLAAPEHRLLDAGSGTVVTCYPAPAFRDALRMVGTVSEEAVEVSGTLTTSQGPATALAFALQLGENLYGKEKRDQIAKEMLMTK